jgi:hypothetical protein
MPFFEEVVDDGDGTMLERADRHQRIDFDAGDIQFGASRHALGGIAVNPFDHGAADPLNAQFIRRYIHIYSKTTVFQCHNTLQTHFNRTTPTHHATSRPEMLARPFKSVPRAGQAILSQLPAAAPFQCPVFPFAFAATVDGVEYNHNAIATPSISNALVMAVTPCQPYRCQNTPPSDPTTLDPR